MVKPVKDVLLLRFSAMGDVAMTAAALREFAPAHPDIHFTMVSRPLFAPFFEGIDNVSFIVADFKNKYKGLPGLWRLFHELRRHKPDAVADMHDVLRTKILSLLFRLWGFKVKKINKGRAEKRRLTRRRNKQLNPLKHMIKRYTEVLLHVSDFRFRIPNSKFEINNQLITHHSSLITHKIGLAPFAKYKGKIYPLERMEKVVAHFAQLKNVEVYLFGGGEEEIKFLAEWAFKYKCVISLAGKMSLSEELAQLATMDVLLSMDSANMHLASLVGVPVVSIWGATHPFAGFTGWRQQDVNNIQIDLPCRPCSVFGNKPCYRHDYACMNIPEEIIIEKITIFLTI
ncbi:MAG: glycosyltransferase family 9 protein [Prevotellaceae bacterium]|jgi:ADP-heptose:LPS heptosyltransferase|nr:glycosyltransferase family 9 protein [Prevotellaceae bacterium]